MADGFSSFSLQDLLFDSADLLAVLESDGVFHRVNAAWRDVLGWEYEDLAGRHFREFVHPSDVDATVADFAESLEEAAGFRHTFTNRVRCKDGGYRWIEWNTRVQDGRSYENGRDVTSEREARAELTTSLGTIRAIFDAANDTIVVLDEELRVVMESSSSLSMLGLTPETRLGRLSLENVHPDDLADVEQALRAVFDEERPRILRYRYRHAEGRWLTLESTGSSFRVDTDEQRLAVFIARDVTQSVADQVLLAETLAMKVAIFNSAADVITVIDRHGRVVETNTASTAVTGVETTDRVGQDVLDVVDPRDVPEVRAVLDEAFAAIDGATRRVRFRLRGRGGETRFAESTVRTIHDGRGPAELAVIVTTDVTDAVVREAALRADLDERDAVIRAECDRVARGTAMIQELVDQRAISTVFQPIVELATSAVVGFEALSRFDREPHRAPNLWFDEAKEFLLGDRLELLAVRVALQSLDEIPSGTFMTVNLSPEYLVLEEFEEVIGAVDSSRVVVELTEHAHVEDYSPIRAKMDALRATGLRFAVDDAGAGFASLQHILMLEPEWIKLDIALVGHIDQDPARRALAASMVHFARETKTRLIGEGIEGESEERELIRIGVGYGQGYFLGRPQPLSEWRNT